MFYYSENLAYLFLKRTTPAPVTTAMIAIAVSATPPVIGGCGPGSSVGCGSSVGSGSSPRVA